MSKYTLDTVKAKLIRISKWAGGILGIILAIVIIFRVGSFLKNVFFPPPEPLPQVSFGVLPKIFFPDSVKKDFTYTIDTLTGELPDFPSQVKVYKIVLDEPDILAVQRADEKVKSLGFNIGPQQLSDTVYRWKSDDALVKDLVISVKLPEFNLSSSFLTNANVLSGKDVPTEAEAISIAQGFIEALSLYPEDIDDEKVVTKLLTISSGVVVPATSFSNAKLVNVYFFQKVKDKLPVIYPQGDLSTMSVTVGSGEREPEVVDARFFYQKISDDGATYPIKTAKEAFEELKSNKAFITSHQGTDLNILIKEVYLGYYIEGRQQDFLTPVIVFEGNNNFFAYVPAVKDEWVDK